MNNPQTTATLIKELAKKKNVSINALLSSCGLNKNAIFTMQSNGYYPRVEAMAKIADYLGCSVDYLLGRTQAQSITVTEAHDNVGVVGQANAPVTIHNGIERQLTTQEKDLLKIYNSITGKQQTELMRFAYELEDSTNG